MEWSNNSSGSILNSINTFSDLGYATFVTLREGVIVNDCEYWNPVPLPLMFYGLAMWRKSKHKS